MNLLDEVKKAQQFVISRYGCLPDHLGRDGIFVLLPKPAQKRFEELWLMKGLLFAGVAAFRDYCLALGYPPKDFEID